MVVSLVHTDKTGTQTYNCFQVNRNKIKLKSRHAINLPNCLIDKRIHLTEIDRHLRAPEKQNFFVNFEWTYLARQNQLRCPESCSGNWSFWCESNSIRRPSLGERFWREKNICQNCGQQLKKMSYWNGKCSVSSWWFWKRNSGWIVLYIPENKRRKLELKFYQKTKK